jgi:histidinol-phosphate aminotransferase
MKKEISQSDWRKNVIRIEPYVPGEQMSAPGLIKLNTNENPFPPSPQVRTAIRSFSVGDLRRYPDSDGRGLRRALARHFHLPEAGVFVGNGSDEVLGLAFRAFFNGGLPVLFPDITYSFYPVWCNLFGIPYEEIPLDAQFRIQTVSYDRPNGGIVIANPNAPTGIGEGQAFVEALMESNRDAVVIIDEAYGAFGCWSATALLSRYDNLLVTKTFSKSRSLAGMRLGFALGSAALIETLSSVKNAFNSYPVSSVAQKVGMAVLRDDAYYQGKIEKIMRTRYNYIKILREMGFTVLESLANFLFVSHEQVPARNLYESLKEKNILVRWWEKPRIDNYLRITIGTEREMAALVAGIREYIEERS